ncbi:MAG: GNAT family N-acetyltransferase, partial [Ktedonobacterales bacterium]|nr:GNAT family N-acetyltransferase [Ktedonobacterales bacterium]
MDVTIHAAIGEEKFALVELLSEAEEGAERVRAAVADAGNTGYGMWSAEGQLVGAALVQWAAASEIIYIAIDAALRGQGSGQRLIAWLI